VFLLVGAFSPAMLVSYLLFVEPGWLDRRAPRGSGPVRPAKPLVAVLAFALVFLCAWDSLCRFRFAPPFPLRRALIHAGLHARFDLFAPDAPKVQLDWEGPGKLADGRSLDVLDATLPEMRARPIFYTRWLKVRWELARLRDEPSLARLGRWLCRRHGPPLSEFTLALRVRATGTPPRSATRMEILAQSCVR
jgi:hypothetical protein